VFNFVVSKLLKSEGVSMFGGVSMLQRAEWQTLNNIAASFTESVQVALQFQNRNFDSFMRSLMPKLKALKLNESLLVPHAISGTPIIFVIEKAGDETANFTIININPELLVFHSAKAEPPKIRFQTCFVLENVALEKVKDDAFWGLAWWVASTPASDSQTMTPVTVLYQILMPFLSGKSFAEIQRDQPNSDGNSELRTPQRSEAGDLKCLTEAFQYFMRRRGLSSGVRKQVSLLLRLTMLEFVINDMRFVQQLSTAERTLLHIACRQISYSTSKLGLLVSDNQSQVLSLEQITGVTLAIDALRNEMARQPCGDAAADVAPPPLVLCEAESAKLNPSLASLLGPKLIANTSEKLVEIDCEGRLAAAEVVGIYFTASWCKPCQKATLQLADVYKKLRNTRGKCFEIVCVSQDQSQQAFESYLQANALGCVALQFFSKTSSGRALRSGKHTDTGAARWQGQSDIS
jgi:thiol-disulfide isomerase/thioredoxin